MNTYRQANGAAARQGGRRGNRLCTLGAAAVLAALPVGVLRGTPAALL